MFVQLSRRAAIILFWPALALVIWGELTPGGGDAIPVWDKALHFTAYFGLTALASVARGSRSRPVEAALALAVLGALLELVQGAVGRDMSFFDEVANVLGAFAGALVGQIFFRVLDRLSRASWK